MYTELKPVIKELMAARSMTYKELGRTIGLSESGVKKLFQADDCSLGRLEDIAKALGTDVSSLIVRAEEGESQGEYEIDAKTQSFLEKHPQIMDVYWLLLIEHLQPEEILAQYKIGKNTLYKCLGELDRRQLIEWKPGDVVVAGSKNSFLLKPNGPLIRRWIERFSASILADLSIGSEPKKAGETFVSQRFLYLRPKSIDELERRLTELMIEFDALSRREKKLPRRQTKPVRLATSFATGSTIKSL